MSERNGLESQRTSSKVELLHQTDLEKHYAICPHPRPLSACVGEGREMSRKEFRINPSFTGVTENSNWQKIFSHPRQNELTTRECWCNLCCCIAYNRLIQHLDYLEAENWRLQREPALCR